MTQRLLIHSLFRSGSTYFWNCFRRSSTGYWCYQEPLHEVVLALEREPSRLLDFAAKEETKYLRHPQLDKPYFSELVEVYQSWRGLVCADIIYDNYFKKATDNRLINYLSALCDAAKGLPVIQECRTAGRIGSIKRALGGFHIYLWRNPWDQWWSYKAGTYFGAINQVILNCSSRPEVINKVRDAIGFCGVDDLNLPATITHFSNRPLSSADAYSVFYAIWCLALLEGITSADLVLNVDSLSDSKRLKANTVAKLQGAGFDNITLTDCKVPQAVFSGDDISFFRSAEDRVHGLFLATGYPQSAIDSINAYRLRNTPKLWGSKSKQITTRHVLEQASRLRQLVIRVETEESLRLRDLLILSEQERTDNLESQKGCASELDNLANELLSAKERWAEDALQKERISAHALAGIKAESANLERVWNDERTLLQMRALELEGVAFQKAVDKERRLAEEIAALKDENAIRERARFEEILSLRKEQQSTERELIKKVEAQERAMIATLSGARDENAILKEALRDQSLQSLTRVQEIDRRWMITFVAKDAAFAEAIDARKKEGAIHERELQEKIYAIQEESVHRERAWNDEKIELNQRVSTLQGEALKRAFDQARGVDELLAGMKEAEINRVREWAEQMRSLQEEKKAAERKIIESTAYQGRALIAALSGAREENVILKETLSREALHTQKRLREVEHNWTLKTLAMEATFAEAVNSLREEKVTQEQKHHERIIALQSEIEELVVSNASLHELSNLYLSRAADQEVIYGKELRNLQKEVADRAIAFVKQREVDQEVTQSKLAANSTELRHLAQQFDKSQREAETVQKALLEKLSEVNAAHRAGLEAQGALFASRAWRYTAILRRFIAWMFPESTVSTSNISSDLPAQGDLAFEAPLSPVQLPSVEMPKWDLESTDVPMPPHENEVHAAMLLEGSIFIKKLYLMVLRREADPEGLLFYTSRLEKGCSKVKILGQILRSKEARAFGARQSELRRSLKAYRQVEGARRRHSRTSGSVNRRVLVLESLTKLDGKRFLKQVYHDLLGRRPDPQGFNFYLNRLQVGIPKSAIISEIRSSSEGMATGAKVRGLRYSLMMYHLTGLPFVGLLFRLFINSEMVGTKEARLRGLEQKVVGLADRLSSRPRCLAYESSKSGKTIPNPAEYLQPTSIDTHFHSEAASLTDSGLTVFTICSKNFTAYAKTLFASVRKHHSTAEQFLVLCDEVDYGYKPELLPFRTILLSDLDIPNVKEMAERYNITEFNTAVKPFAFSYLFKKLLKDRVVYIDPDILLTSPLEELVKELDRGAECVLTPHVLEPAENVEVSDIKMLMFGIYNLGFIALRNTPNVVRIVEWWGRRLEGDCVIDLPNGLFVDQKWADLLPAYIANTTIIRHPGYNVAYWNLSQRRISYTNGTWYSNEVPLRFVHFSGNKLDDREVFSRHSSSITLETIGDLAQLLNQYREAVYANGHSDYSRLPYSFNWNGARGVNLHTQKPADSSDKCVPFPVPPLASLMASDSMETSDGDRATYSGGSALPWKTRLLFIDCVTPQPDRDAGSITAYHLLKIFVDLGYDVTFIPSDLAHLGDYTRAVESLRVRCLHRAEILSIRDHLKIAGTEYEYIFVCRAPIADLYIDDIRQFAPQSKIILNTSDLHYLRDMREAEVSGEMEKLNAARKAKSWELSILQRCDVTIVMSTAELKILQTELPSVDVRLIPLMYVEAVADCPRFESRSDILFIGGFPHAPNVDAVIFFATKIFPLIRKELPDVTFHVVGNAPPPQILELNSQPGIIVHGFVADIAPLFSKCRLSVAPLRYGAGIKGKIGTSLAYGVPAVATSIAVEGMRLIDGEHVLVADTPEQFVAKLVKIYTSGELWNEISRRGRDLMLREYSPAVGQQRIARLMKSLLTDNKHLALHTLRSMGDYTNLRTALKEELEQRVKLERSLICYDQSNFFLQGFCAVCGTKSSFNTSFMYSYESSDDGRRIPNWREHLDCVTCGFTNRIRAALHIFYSHVNPPKSASIYLTEQSTALFRWLQHRQPNLVGSEYFGNIAALGAQVRGLRNEDLTRLTFADETFDHVLSFDVLEHVNNDIAALEEMYRCLKFGGTVLFGAPFARERTQKLIRARIDADGNVQHLMAPEYHGNPVDPTGGALCYRYFAWDLIDDMRSIGFKDPRVLHYWSEDFAYLGVEQFLFIAVK